jgi:hypothetical protein
MHLGKEYFSANTVITMLPDFQFPVFAHFMSLAAAGTFQVSSFKFQIFIAPLTTPQPSFYP